MMNPQYMPPGQNNNAPNNPLGFPPTGQDFNGHQNANIYSPMPTNGPTPPMKPLDQSDVTQKLQNINLNGPQGYTGGPPSQIPPGQLPPGANMPPTSMMPGPPTSMMPGPPTAHQRPSGGFPPGPVAPISRPPPQQIPSPMPPQSSTPGPIPTSHPQAFQMSSQNQNIGEVPHSRPFMPPSQGPPSMATSNLNQLPSIPQQHGPPSSQPSQFPQVPTTMGQIPPQNRQPGPIQQQPGLQQPQMGMPPQQPLPSQPGLPPQPGFPPQPSQMARQPGLPPQPGPMMPLGSPGSQGPQKYPGHQQQAPPGPAMAGLPHMPPPMNQQQGRQFQGMPPANQQLSQGKPSGPPNNAPYSGMPPMPGQPPMDQPNQLSMGQPGQPHMGQPGQHPMGQPGQLSMGQPGQPPIAHPGQTPMARPSQPPMGHPGQAPMAHPSQQPMAHPGQPPMPHPGQPPMAHPGQPPMAHPSQPPMAHPGQPPMAHPGQPPMAHPGLPPMTHPGQPPMAHPGQPPIAHPGQPPMAHPGQPPMAHPGQQSMAHPGQPPMPGQQPSGYMPQAYQTQPPFPGQQPSYPGGQQYPGYQQPQQQVKRLDPDQMPSPIQVMTDDQQNRGGIFVTNDRGLVPPLVTTDFIVEDKGNASPRYIRSSMYSVPVTAELLKQTSLPFCLAISPMAETLGSEQEPPLLDFANLTNSPTMGPVRCSRCKAYMCPNMKFIDSGRHFKCAFCKATTEVPMEYTQYINSMQQYGRLPAEMALGAYEIVATKEYCRNNTLPNPPAIVFVLDVSYNAVKNGLVHTVCENIMNIIDNLPRDSAGDTWTRVGFITYSTTVHFYNIKGSLAQPQMLSVGDVGDMFVPLLEGFLVRAEDSGPVLQALLQQLPTMFADNRETEIILLPAVQAGLEALKAADTSGQLLVFHTSLPTYQAPGKLTNREDRKLLGTDKEKQILSPQTTAYNELGQACSAAGVCVEMFIANNSYVDTATIGQLSRLTGGQLHKYTYFQADLDGGRLIEDVVRVVSRPTAHDAVMRVRTSTGVRATDFYGHFFMSNTTDVELAAIDADKAIGVEIKHDDKLSGEDGVYIQAALLYTHRSGQRRLRVLNLALNVAHQLADVYRSCELDTLVNFLTKQAIWSLRDSTPRQVREGLSVRCVRSLASYRKNCASPSSAGQLVLPESCKLLPLYTSCMRRSDSIAGGPDMTCDDRSCAMYRSLTADVSTSVVLTYPRLLPLHLLGEAPPDGLPSLRASIDKMTDTGVYLLENGVHMLLWVGSQAPSQFLREVFGVTTSQQIEGQVGELPELDTELSEAARACVQEARVRRRTHMRLTIMRQHDKLEAVLRHFLVEDHGIDGSSSYVDFLCHIHKEIRALL